MKKIKSAVILVFIVIMALSMCGCNRSVKEFSGVVSTAEELSALDKYKNLASADFSGSTCYGLIEDYAASHPQVDVKYSVQIGSQWVDSYIDAVSISSPEEADALVSLRPYLKALSSAELKGEAVTADVVGMLRSAMPEVELSYTVTLLGQELPCSQAELDLSPMTEADTEAVLEALPLFPDVKKVNLVGSDGMSTVSLDDFCRIKTVLPDAQYTFAYDVFGTVVNQSTEELGFSRLVRHNQDPLGNGAVDTFRQLLFCSDALKRLEIIDCGIDYELLAQLRDEFPEKEVVWQVLIGPERFMTDTTVVRAIGGLDNDQLAPLKYCINTEYADLGHNGFSDISFTAYMPHLKVLIIALTDVSDLTPLSSCKELEYLEICISRVSDLTPLSQCVSLQNLNIGQLHTLTDITPLYELKNLKRVFGIWDPDIPMEQKEKLKELNPDAEIDFDFDIDPLAGRWRMTSNGPDEYYLRLVDIFHYPGIIVM